MQVVPFELSGFLFMELTDEQVKKFKEINRKAGVPLGSPTEIMEIASSLADFLIATHEILKKKNEGDPLEQCQCGQCTMHDKL